jgi:hypothetical protein
VGAPKHLKPVGGVSGDVLFLDRPSQACMAFDIRVCCRIKVHNCILSAKIYTRYCLRIPESKFKKKKRVKFIWSPTTCDRNSLAIRARGESKNVIMG